VRPSVIGATFLLTLFAIMSSIPVTPDPVSATSDPILVIEGDSQSEDSFNGYTRYLARNLQHHHRTRRMAVGGDTLQGMLADFDLEIAPLFDPRAPYNVLHVWAGTNDLFFGATAEQAIERLKALCNKGWRAGFIVVTATIPDRSYRGGAGYGPDPPELSRQRVVFNDWLRANWRLMCDGMADLAADERLGAEGASANPLYFHDRVHLTNEGARLAAEIMADAIEKATQGEWAAIRN
jgi:lysophospholipase L1-like esterase